eukprot:CAMPEP_0202958238 /NCGR_PEP_ID=MMETSP1396-20130829/2601_1 /ASSEMBLY_ACC=CAM_ASM_000872 /TAXON_ID= /ORGANISM="Pseudokeronopsis sp., Strain Brazil" /LENGTH=100 /DNA_ID=CAMNT_0049676197 /DNA_START=115 /DNA_END=417 /DNA_ORIENTATION=+
MEVHPTKAMQDNLVMQAERQYLQHLSVHYGSHFAMRTVLDRSILGSHRRLGTYGSSMHGLNLHMGRYEQLDFFDYIGDKNASPDLEKEGIHAQMEKVYGI